MRLTQHSEASISLLHQLCLDIFERSRNRTLKEDNTEASTYMPECTAGISMRTPPFADRLIRVPTILSSAREIRSRALLKTSEYVRSHSSNKIDTAAVSGLEFVSSAEDSFLTGVKSLPTPPFAPLLFLRTVVHAFSF
ncbi:uncharacterized protein [Linepithema humile]|uniref:uncharacterized protein isoform X2 n=1 Tax=Linepithema humile TaxID=83485 RepID=UPI00351E6BD1